jgi:hypothetical protein
MERLYLSFETKTRMTAKVTVAEVERVAELAHLELAPEEIEPMLRDLNAILDYVAELNQLDTSGIEPLAQVGELENAAIPLPPPGCRRAIAGSLRRHGPGPRNRRRIFQSAEGD